MPNLFFCAIVHHSFVLSRDADLLDNDVCRGVAQKCDGSMFRLFCLWNLGPSFPHIHPHGVGMV